MIGTAAFLGMPLLPWHVLQTSNLAPRIASASAAFPGVGSAGTSMACSTAFAGAASAARTTRIPKAVGKPLLIMFTLPLFYWSACGPVTRPTRWNHLKHAAVGFEAQDGAGFRGLSIRSARSFGPPLGRRQQSGHGSRLASSWR